MVGNTIDDVGLPAAWLLESSKPTTLDMLDGGHFFLRQQEAQFLAHLHEKLAHLIRVGNAHG